MKTVRERVDPVIVETLRRKTRVHPELRLMEDLGFDSMGLIELVGRLEDEFDVVIPVDSLGRIRTVGDVYAVAECPQDYGIVTESLQQSSSRA